MRKLNLRTDDQMRRERRFAAGNKARGEGRAWAQNRTHVSSRRRRGPISAGLSTPAFAGMTPRGCSGHRDAVLADGAVARTRHPCSTLCLFVRYVGEQRSLGTTDLRYLRLSAEMQTGAGRMPEPIAQFLEPSLGLMADQLFQSHARRQSARSGHRFPSLTGCPCGVARWARIQASRRSEITSDVAMPPRISNRSNALRAAS